MNNEIALRIFVYCLAFVVLVIGGGMAFDSFVGSASFGGALMFFIIFYEHGLEKKTS